MFPDKIMHCHCSKFIILIHKVSDIHISKYREPQRGKDLKQFCNENIDVIRPVAVLATGKEITMNVHAAVVIL